VRTLFDAKLRPPWTRLVVALLLATAALWLFDRVHVAQTGADAHGFWRAYLDRQVVPSLSEDGGSHTVKGPTALYYVSRFLLYTLPWSLVVLWRLVRGPRPLPSPEAWRLAAAWIVAVLVGLSLGSREASRYVFQAFIATSLLTALALPREPKGDSAWAAFVLLVLALPAQIALKHGFLRGNDGWRATAEAAAAHRFASEGLAQPVVAGAFQPEDDRMKSLLRFHLDAWTSSAPVTEMKGLQWVVKAGEDFPIGRVVFATPFGALVDFRK
jgi:hypothetical protein